MGVLTEDLTDFRFIQRVKDGVVPVCQRSASRDDPASFIVANRPELTHTANLFARSNVPACTGVKLANTDVNGVKSQRVRAYSAPLGFLSVP